MAHFYPCLTAAELDAVREAMAERLAGPLEGVDQRPQTYENAADALYNSSRADVALFLTKSEARGLLAFAGEGAAGLLTDPPSARAYIGNHKAVAAAENALAKLRREV